MHTPVTTSDPIRLSSRALLFALAAILAVSALFLIWPQLDLAVARHYYSTGSGFPAKRAEALISLRKGGMLVTRLAVICLIVFAVMAAIRPSLLTRFTPSSWIFLAGTLAAAPGLLVNSFLKNVWGRPRPVHLEAFGGDAPYSPVWQISDYCQRNCSFVSGEASSSFWLVALTFIVPKRWRLLVLAVTLTWAVPVSLNRVAFGGHFLSDVLLSWLLTLTVLLLAHRLLLAEPRRSAINHAIAGRLMRWRGISSNT